MALNGDLSAARQALRDELRELERRALRGRRQRTQAIAVANERQTAAGLPKLTPTTVGGWFEAGTPARDFESLWALVRVLLEWSEQSQLRSPRGPAEVAGKLRAAEAKWTALWRQAKNAAPAAPARSGLEPRISAYLTAARQAALQHPYPGIPGAEGGLPSLADVYVRQHARGQEPDDPHNPDTMGRPGPGGAAGTTVAATEVFRTDSSICVLLASPGGGKSTLLRAHLAESAARWLSNRAGKTIPALVSARDLADTDVLPALLAKATTRALSRFGLLDDLTAEFFRRQPRTGVPWLVLVDGLDEIPDTDTRRTVLRLLVGVTAGQPALYRFVVATRPLPARELDTLGSQVPRFQLQPFSSDNLLDYATQWFRGLENPGRHAKVFISGLQRSRLDVLARTPLMASMLCQLYAADPTRPLPKGRTGAYQAFVDLIYEQNTHKPLASAHDEAIHRLKDRHQIPRDSQAAKQAAELVRDRLPELIDELAYKRINGDPAPAIVILASHLHVNRPPKVKEELWESFLSDLLRTTGLLAQRADDFDFLHQTLMEYHAARHATRDDEARMHLLDALFPLEEPPAGDWEPPDLDPSHLGFLLDQLLEPEDHIAVDAAQRIQARIRPGGGNACRFLVGQVRLRTNLRQIPTADRLTCFAQDTTLDGSDRVEAAEALAGLDGHMEAATRLLTNLANDPTLSSWDRRWAAEALGGVDGHAEDAARLLASLANDTTLGRSERVKAAAALGGVDGHAEDAARLLASLANDTTSPVDDRRSAAEALGGVDGHAEDAARLLASLANDPTLSSWDRRWAAAALGGVDGHAEDAARLLASLANDTTLDSHERLWAAEYLAKVDGHVDEAAAVLASLANDTTLDRSNRVWAARSLGELDGHAEDAARLLTTLANDTTLPGGDRVKAAQAMGKVDGHVEDAARLLASLANNTTLPGGDRVKAAQAMGKVDGHAEDAAAVLTTLANDTTLDSDGRVWAAEALAKVDGHAEDAAAVLTTLANDTTLDRIDRERAARAVADLRIQRGADARGSAVR
ncbi:hypothetical protein AB0950_38275 [Streptomyces sp. NPDC007189]|uniref:NACHT domain-containing protein n=1 Tax=Streptomyces sp. NPDC007189 TaxID=3154315 RepID=UPI003455D382